MSYGKVLIIHVIVGLIKNISLHKMNYFPEQYTCSENKIKVKLNLSNYATKFDPKNSTGLDISNFVKMAYLASLKLKVYKLDNDRLESDPVD